MNNDDRITSNIRFSFLESLLTPLLERAKANTKIIIYISNSIFMFTASNYKELVLEELYIEQILCPRNFIEATTLLAYSLKEY